MNGKTTISINTTDINNTIAQIKELAERAKIMEMLKRVVEAIIKLANEELTISNQEPELVFDIMNSWRYEINADGTGTLMNTHDKAVYLEFGVGANAELDVHPRASRANYEYNIPSEAKVKGGWWVFDGSEQLGRIDIAPEHRREKWGKNNLWIITKGQPGVMYLFKALTRLENMKGL